MKINQLLTAGFIMSTIALSQTVYGEDLGAIAKETESAVAATASTKPTSQAIIEKVNEACALLEKEGAPALPKFRGKDSKFLFYGTYIWVHDMKGIMRLHPIKYKLNDTSILAMKDPNGKAFFVEMNDVVKKKGAGWMDYMWAKPGENKPSRKVSYVKLAKNGTDEFVVGCGVYDLPEAEVDALVKQ